ncbi:hypothetical protein [Iodobacter fluviatilis]|uniref:hypothetical protein n=1 Tax=Iodobacter fluviatilis TaxID=537 RepID=UPI00104CD072|nr:hypothetical protein [Iodobacter fluviatilis]
MNEWILVLTLHLISAPGEVRDISPQIVSGFTSKQNCENAAVSISERLIGISGKARERQGIPSNTSKSSPAINYECLNIRK